MARTRETFRPSSRHDADTMWTVRYGEHLIRHHSLDDRRLRYDALSPAKTLAVQIARTYEAQYRADDEGRWNDSGSLGAAIMAMTTAYSHLAAVEKLPYLLDGEPQNWNERVPVPMDND